MAEEPPKAGRCFFSYTVLFTYLFAIQGRRIKQENPAYKDIYSLMPGCYSTPDPLPKKGTTPSFIIKLKPVY
jgi:hypothetical protein